MNRVTPIVELRDLSIVFPVSQGRDLYAVDGMTLAIEPGEVIGIVGESGSGKSVTAQAMLGLTVFNGGRITYGQTLVDGRDLTDANESTWRQVRGRTIGMVFQEPLSALNPLLSIGTQMKEAIERAPDHAGPSWRDTATRLLAEVQMHEPGLRVNQYPHELSGGMRQRVTIAMALAQQPRLLVADEATTALDVTVQREIVELLLRLNQARGLAVVFISHDLALVGEFCRRIIVMYGGHTVEEGPTDAVLGSPGHPYTALLLQARPSAAGTQRDRRLVEIDGSVKPAYEPARLCRFLERCPVAMDTCRREAPPWRAAQDQRVRCWKES